VVPIAAPTCPKELSPEAKRKWRELVPLLLEAGLLTPLDRSILAMYCSTWSTLVAAQAILAREGLTVPTGEGGVKNHPVLAIQQSATNQLRLLGQQLGLSPEGRLRLHVQGAPAQEESKAKYFRIP
jgi:P27 family predicted phage terminase small subunit